MSLTQEFQDAISADHGERVVCDLVKRHPRILSSNFSQLAEVQYVVAEFPLGTEYRVDFVTLGPFSGAFEVHFIEFEPPSAHPVH